jgi:Protein of unknown function (DUF2568)
VTSLRGANLALRFLLELSAIAAVVYWGFEAGSGIWGWFLAVGAAALVLVVWALFISPKATIELERPLRLVLEFTVFGAAAVALAAAGQVVLAVVFAVVAAVSGTLNYVWEEPAIRPPRTLG